MDYLKRTWADISLDNLNHNYQQLRAKIPSGCRLLGVVKADAYGHGAVPISRHLCELGAEFLAVSNLEEAMQLRRGGIRRPILILGYTPPAYARDLVAMGLRQEVHSLEYARALHEELKGSERRLKVHIKLDTGMSRLGFFAYDHPKTVEELKEVAQMPKLLIEGIFMHFPVADSIDGADANFTHTQFERFTQMLSALKGVGIEPEIRHCCNSGATILYPEYALDMVRPGIALYGVGDDAERLGLRPVMTLKTTVSTIKVYEPGTSVSYGRRFVTDRTTRMGVVPYGYADGFFRVLSDRCAMMTADGPAGLRIKPECGVTTTAFPCATLLACTWNTEIVREIGAAGAHEVHENGIGEENLGRMAQRAVAMGGGKLGNFQFAWAEAAIIRLCCAVQNGLRCRISGKNLRQKGAEIRCMLGKRQV